MENNILKLRSEFFANTGQIYSICMRGARLWDKTNHLYIYTNGEGELIDTAMKVDPKYVADIVSQRQYKFDDLSPIHYSDNYDTSARIGDGLLKAMMNVYKDFDTKEIVTIVQFKILE